MKRKDRFLPLGDLKMLATALAKGSRVAVSVVRAKDGHTFMAGNGPKDEMEEMLRDALNHVVLGAPEGEPAQSEEEPSGPSRLVLP